MSDDDQIIGIGGDAMGSASALSLIPRISTSSATSGFYRALSLIEGDEGHDRLFRLMIVW